jgi:hypothetical protein
VKIRHEKLYIEHHSHRNHYFRGEHSDAGLYKSKTVMRIFRVAKCDIEFLDLGWVLELEPLACLLSTMAFTMSTATSVRLRSALWRRLALDFLCWFLVKPESTAAKLKVATQFE